jgi:hypothetical protein
MSILELIEAARTTVLDDQDIAALKKRLEEAEKEFEKKSRAQAPRNEFLSRTYSL